MCMFCTSTDELPFNTRPMATVDVDAEGNLWFMSYINSNKNDEIKDDDKVQLIYAKGGDSHFLRVSGKAFISKTRKKQMSIGVGLRKPGLMEKEIRK